MTDVITLSSESDEDDSDVEIVGSYSHFMTKADPLPLSAVRVDVDALNVNVPTHYIDLKDPRWSMPELKMRKRKNSTSLVVVDLTENDMANGTKQETETENLPQNDFQLKEEEERRSAKLDQTSNQKDYDSQRSSSSDPTVQLRDCMHKPKQRCLDLQTQHQKQTANAHHCIPTVKLKRLPFLKTRVTDLKISSPHVLFTNDCTQMSLNISPPGGHSETPECSSNLRTTNGPHTEPDLDQAHLQTVGSPVRQEQQEKRNELTSKQVNAERSHLESTADCPLSDRGTTVTDTREYTLEDVKDALSYMLIPSPSSSLSCQDKAHFQKEVLCSNLEELKSDISGSRQSYLSAYSSPHPPPTELISSGPNDIDSLSQNLMSQVVPASTSEQTPAENTSEWQLKEVKTDEASGSSDLMHWSAPVEPPLSVFKAEDMDGGSGSVQYVGDLGNDSPLSFQWSDEFNGEQENTDSRSEMNFRAASEEDRHFVCPSTLKELTSGTAQALIHKEEKDLGSPEVLCRQSLSLVYTTIDVNYPEGTLQLLSDLLQPGYNPPKDITFHLLHGILLDPQCPYHLCVQAFNMLMRTQRHHMADKTTVPWDWEQLTTFMGNQDQTKRHRIEVVRMLLEYVVQTLEDDFKAKCSSSDLHLSIAKATLSCDQQFSHVRDVIKWLFSIIMKTTEHGESTEAAREKEEQIRMVSILQRMLSLALEVDRSPVITSAKLSQELFHMLVGDVPLRAHRMVLKGGRDGKSWCTFSGCCCSATTKQ
uniref:uncharacterized protein simc1 isoform X2 n=1 Tax=Semicossyphus pulcher TaxID=241346 RepID=UPI0037E86989